MRPHIRCKCVDVSPHAAHYTARDTRTGHGCVPAQAMVLLFLAALFGYVPCRGATVHLEIHRNQHHIDSKGLLTVGKTRTAPF